MQAYSIQNNTIQYGDTLARFSKLGYMIVPKNPVLLIIDSLQKTDSLTGKPVLAFDTMRIKSKIMEAFQGDSAHFIATDSVQLLAIIFLPSEENYIIRKMTASCAFTEIKSKPCGMTVRRSMAIASSCIKKKEARSRRCLRSCICNRSLYRFDCAGRMNQLSSQKMTLFVQRYGALAACSR